jgi:hypothetical protein
VPLTRLREAVEGGIAARSLRGVAREVGMSPSGLQKFIDGATPYSMTRRKLERWYVREAAQYGGGPGAGSALAALHILTHELPLQQREEATREILEVREAAHRGLHRRIPAWIVEIQRRAGEGDV